MSNISAWREQIVRSLGDYAPVIRYPNDLSDISYSADWSVQSLVAIGWLCVLEYLLLWIGEKPLPAAHENLLSIAMAIFNAMVLFSLRSVQYSVYIWVWQNYSLFSHTFSNSILSFVAAVLLVDFAYYWLHRLAHEVALFWSIHQVHHLSEDFMVSVGLRHSPLQNLFSWAIYLPLAVVGLPPVHLFAHLQLNLIYQCWIHTCAIEKLGLFEIVFNTPSHHRVHHGSTRYCIDKNYGGILIVWDRLFGTFQKELPGEKIIYGILHQPRIWNLVDQQIFYLQLLISKAKSMNGWINFINTFWKGPSWEPGSSRIGSELEPTVDPSSRVRLKANASGVINSYVLLHLIAALYLFSTLTITLDLDLSAFILYNVLILGSLTVVGFLYEGRSFVARFEIYRCLASLILTMALPLSSGVPQISLLALYSISLVIWFSPSRIHTIKFGIKEEVTMKNKEI